MNMNSPEFFDLLILNDADAWSVFYHEALEIMYLVAKKNLRDEDAASDATHQKILEFYAAIERWRCDPNQQHTTAIRHRSKLQDLHDDPQQKRHRVFWSLQIALRDGNRGYFTTAITNYCINLQKRRGREVGTDFDDTPPTDPTREESEVLSDKEFIAKALRELSAEDQELLCRCHIEKQAEVVIAEELGLPRGTVHDRIKRAETRFRDAYERQCKRAQLPKECPANLEQRVWETVHLKLTLDAETVKKTLKEKYFHYTPQEIKKLIEDADDYLEKQFPKKSKQDWLIVPDGMRLRPDPDSKNDGDDDSKSV